MTPQQALIKAYASYGSSNVHSSGFRHRLNHLKFIDKNIKKCRTILDTGCGSGVFVLALRNLGYSATGCDKYVFAEHGSYGEERRLIKAKDVIEKENLTILPLDVLEDELPKADVVLSLAVIEHIRQPREFLERLSQYPQMYIATPNLANLKNRLRFLLGRPPVQNITEYLKPDFRGHVREYTLSELKYMSELFGHKVVRVNGNEFSEGIAVLTQSG